MHLAQARHPRNVLIDVSKAQWCHIRSILLLPYLHNKKYNTHSIRIASQLLRTTYAIII